MIEFIEERQFMTWEEAKVYAFAKGCRLPSDADVFYYFNTLKFSKPPHAIHVWLDRPYIEAISIHQIVDGTQRFVNSWTRTPDIISGVLLVKDV